MSDTSENIAIATARFGRVAGENDVQILTRRQTAQRRPGADQSQVASFESTRTRTTTRDEVGAVLKMRDKVSWTGDLVLPDTLVVT